MRQFISKTKKTRRFLLRKQLFYVSKLNSKTLTFDHFKFITDNKQSHPIYFTFFNQTLTSFWQNTDWDDYVQGVYNFSAEYINFRYFKDICFVINTSEKFNEINDDINDQTLSNIIENTNIKRKTLLSFIYTYNYMFTQIFFERHFWFKHYVNNNVLEVVLNLTLSFCKNQVFLHLQDLRKRDYFFASLGFFLKFFGKKKSIKKNKIMKFLLAKFIRKLFIISGILSANLMVRGLPTNLVEMLAFIKQPLRYKFIDPSDGLVIDESRDKIENQYRVNFNYIIFIKNKAFGFVRLRQKGRIKRKLIRKLIKRHDVTD